MVAKSCEIIFTSPIITESKGEFLGKNIVIMAGVHGNESFGVDVIKELIPKFKIRKGKLTSIIANPEAIKQNKRFIEYNLNRCFIKKQPKKILNTLEGKIAREIIPFLENTDWLLDIHGSNSPNSIPFIICEKQSFEVAEKLPGGIISFNWDKFQPGSSDFYMNKQNKIGICVECGYIRDKKSKDIAEETIKSFLILAGAIEGKIKKTIKKKFVKIIYQYKNKSNIFRKTKNFADFEKLKQKTLIGTDGNKKVYGKEGDVLLFVRDRANIGEECFLKAKETLLNSKKLDSSYKKIKMKSFRVEIRPFKFGDYVRFLKVRLSPKTRKEFARSVLGYFIVALKDFSSRIKAYKFSVYSNDRLAGFAGIFDERGYDELVVFILPEYRGKGIATQTTEELVKYCFSKLKLKKIRVVTDELRLKLEKILKNQKFRLVKKDTENKIRVWELRKRK